MAARPASTSVFDVTDADSVRAAVEQIEAEGPIDILINNAGMQIRGPLHEYADSDWHTIMKTNLDSVYFVGQAVGRGTVQLTEAVTVTHGTSFRWCLMPGSSIARTFARARTGS
eukprot:gene26049-32578_t